MTKHILDRDRLSDRSARSAHYMRIGASEHPKPQSKALQKRPRATDAASRAKRFLEIDRQNA